MGHRGAVAAPPRVSAQRRALVSIAGAQLLALTLWFSASAAAPQLERAWGLAGSQATWLTLAVQIGFVVGAVGLAITGLPDAVGARAIFTGASLIGATANLALLAMNGDRYFTAVLLRAMTGAALAGVYPSGMKVMSGWFDRGRGRALGILVAALTVGSAGPHLIRGLGLDWQGVIGAASLLAFVAAVVMWFMVADGPFETAPQRFSFRHISCIVRNRGVRLATYGYLGHMWELYAMWAWTAAYLTASAEAGGYSAGFVPTATFLIIGIGGPGSWLAGVWADRRGRTLAAGAAMAVSGTAALLTPLVFGLTPIVVIPLFIIWGFSVVADSAQFSAMVTETATDPERGTALTLQTALGFLLTLVTIQGVPLVADWLGWRWSFALLAAGPAFGIWAMARLKSIPEARRLAGGLG